LRRTAIQAARIRRRNLILIYHRIGAPRDEPTRILRTLPVEVFRSQIDALRTVGTIVPLRDLLEPGRDDGAVRFAITFDDDDWRHRRFALPALQSLDVQATFFLSGRSLHGLGPYWWELLEAALDHHDLAHVSRALDMPADNPTELAAAYQAAPVPDRLRDMGVPDREYPELEARDIRSLAGAGMEIGFHTLHHPVLVDLPVSEIDRALLTGREDLSQAAGQPIELFAYPHGRGNRSVSDRVKRAGYRAAFTGSARAVGPRSNKFLLSRWEPASLESDRFLASVALRLNLSDGVPRG
jgi:peptidoglycan/xylan/chitin deacetylase (PgdA/CDA1 family)